MEITDGFLDSPVWHTCQLGEVSPTLGKVFGDDKLWRSYFERRFNTEQSPKRSASRSPSPTSAKLSYAHYHSLERRFREGLYGKHDRLSPVSAKGMAVLDVRLSPLGAFAALRNGAVVAYDVGTTASPTREYRPEDRGSALCVLADELVLAGYSQGHICGWQPCAQPCVDTKAHDGRVCALSRLDDTLLSAGSDGRAKAWDAQSFAQKASFNGHTASVVSVAAAWSDGHSFLTGSHDRTVQLWDVRTGSSVAQWRQQDWVTCVDFHPTEAHKFFSSDKSVHEWDLRAGQVVSSVHRHRKLVSRFRVDPLRLASCSLDGSVKVSSLEEHHMRCASPKSRSEPTPDVCTLRTSQDYVLCIDFDATRLLAGNVDGLVDLYDFSDTERFRSGPSPLHSPHVGHCGEPVDIHMTGLHELEV